MYNACFTGHRKVNNSFYNAGNPTPEWAALGNYLRTVVSAFIDNNITTFYTGMAIGVDTVGAEAVAFVRSFKAQPVSLIAAVPFPSQPSKWPAASQAHYKSILALCNSVHHVNEDPYAPWKMHARDRFMVDNSSYVIAVWDGRHGGGTYYTANYAIEQGKKVFVIHPTSLKGGWFTP